MPRLTCSGWTTAGLPSTSVKALFISGTSRSARTTAYPMRCVKLTLPPRPRRRWLLMTMRLSAISFAGTARTLVAVGSASEACMLLTTRAAAPRSVCAPGGGVGPLGCRGTSSRRRRSIEHAVRGPRAGPPRVRASRRTGAGVAATGAVGASLDVVGVGVVDVRAVDDGVAVAVGPVVGVPVVGEEVVPRGVDAARVGEVALVHVLHEPLVGAEVAGGDRTPGAVGGPAGARLLSGDVSHPGSRPRRTRSCRLGERRGYAARRSRRRRSRSPRPLTAVPATSAGASRSS